MSVWTAPHESRYPPPLLEKMFDEWKIHPCDLTMTNGRFRSSEVSRLKRSLRETAEIKIFFLPGDTRFVNKITVHHPPPGDHQFSLCWFDITSTKSSTLITLFHEIYFRKFSWNVSFIRDEYNKQASIFEKRKREKNFLIELKSSCTKDNNGARFSRVHWRHACPAFVYTVSVSFYRQPVRFHECAVTFHK